MNIVKFIKTIKWLASIKSWVLLFLLTAMSEETFFLFSWKLLHKLFVKGAQAFQYFFHGVCGGHDAKSAKTSGSVEYLCCVTLTLIILCSFKMANYFVKHSRIWVSPDVVGALLLSVFSPRTKQHSCLLQQSHAVKCVWLQSSLLKHPNKSALITKHTRTFGSILWVALYCIYLFIMCIYSETLALSMALGWRNTLGNANAPPSSDWQLKLGKLLMTSSTLLTFSANEALMCCVSCTMKIMPTA